MPCDIHISATAHGDLYFHCALGFATQQLAYTLDSLVRVTRRVVENHFVRIDEDTSAHTPCIITTTEDSGALNRSA